MKSFVDRNLLKIRESTHRSLELIFVDEEGTVGTPIVTGFQCGGFVPAPVMDIPTVDGEVCLGDQAREGAFAECDTRTAYIARTSVKQPGWLRLAGQSRSPFG